MVSVGQTVEINLGEEKSIYTVSKVEGDLINIQPKTLPESQLQLINGEWKVIGTEQTPYEITFQPTSIDKPYISTEVILSSLQTRFPHSIVVEILRETDYEGSELGYVYFNFVEELIDFLKTHTNLQDTIRLPERFPVKIKTFPGPNFYSLDLRIRDHDINLAFIDSQIGDQVYNQLILDFPQ